MEAKLIYEGTVSESGQITLPPRLKSEVAGLFAGKSVVVTWERKKKKRSADQNAYYWGVIIRLIYLEMNAQGENVMPQEVHEFLKFRFLRVQRINQDTGEILFEFGRSTTRLKTTEFMLYMDNCIQFASEYLSIVIPPPHTCRDEYLFPEYSADGETRADYLIRISEYLNDIHHIDQLYKYFRQNPEWNDDKGIKALFSNRKAELSKIK
jgi:hypothetical protein